MVWVLQLNDMRSPKVEILTIVCTADSKEALEKLLQDNKVDNYRDGHWGKSYKQGSPLEWFNPPYHDDVNSTFVDLEKWKNDEFKWAMQSVEDRYNAIIRNNPKI